MPSDEPKNATGWGYVLELFARQEKLVKPDGSVHQGRLADAIGVRQSTISRILSGERTPDIDTASKIAAVAGVPHGTVLRDFAPLEASPAALVMARRIDALPKSARDVLDRHIEVFLELLSTANQGIEHADERRVAEPPPDDTQIFRPGDPRLPRKKRKKI